MRAMTGAGLNTVNLGSIKPFQQSVFSVLIFVGNITTASVVTAADSVSLLQEAFGRILKLLKS